MKKAEIRKATQTELKKRLKEIERIVCASDKPEQRLRNEAVEIMAAITD